MDLIDISNPSTNRPGIGGRLYVAELAWISAYGAAATVTNPGDELRITGDHTFSAGKGFRVWEMEDDQARLMIPIIGSRSSKGLKGNVDAFFSSLTPAQASMFQENKDLMLLVEAFGCNATQKIQLGDACNPLRIVAGDGFNSGVNGGTDPRGWKIKFENNYSVYFYEGDVTLYP
jgi:hypothetical protein